MENIWYRVSAKQSKKEEKVWFPKETEYMDRKTYSKATHAERPKVFIILIKLFSNLMVHFGLLGLKLMDNKTVKDDIIAQCVCVFFNLLAVIY